MLSVPQTTRERRQLMGERKHLRKWHSLLLSPVRLLQALFLLQPGLHLKWFLPLMALKRFGVVEVIHIFLATQERRAIRGLPCTSCIPNKSRKMDLGEQEWS